MLLAGVRLVSLLCLGLLLASAFGIPAALADKGAIPINPTPIYEAGQKAVVAWNGEREILILSVDLNTAGGKTWTLEVLPLPSMPFIEEGSEETFQVLNKYFLTSMVRRFQPAVKAAGVEIVFHEQMGPHDVTVAKADSGRELVEWLLDYAASKGLPKPASQGLEKAEKLVEDYVSRGYHYYAIDLVEVSGELKSVSPLVYSFKTPYAYFPLEISTLAKGETSITIFLVTPGKPRIEVFRRVGLKVAFQGPIPLKVLGKADPRLGSLFQPGKPLWLTVALYRGDLSKLRGDLTITMESLEKWVPYTPKPWQVKLRVEQTGRGPLLKASIFFPNAGFRVKWGELRLEGSLITVEAKVERWTGPAAQVAQIVSHSYWLDRLPPGRYMVTFEANGKPIIGVPYNVGGESALIPMVLLSIVAAAPFAVTAFDKRRS